MQKFLRYLKIYIVMQKRSLKYLMTYRFSFFIEIIVEVGYSLGQIVFFHVLFSNIQSLGGWDYNKMLLLMGLNIVVSEIVVGFFFVNNLRLLPERLESGQFEIMQRLPIDSLFHFSLSSTYISSLISCVPGFYLIVNGIIRSQVLLGLGNTVVFICVIICGLCIAYGILVMISCLAFLVPISDSSIPRLGYQIMFRFMKYPHTIYQGTLLWIFTYIVPIIFMVSVPVQILVEGFDPKIILLALVLALGFLFLAKFVWYKSVQSYEAVGS